MFGLNYTIVAIGKLIQLNLLLLILSPDVGCSIYFNGGVAHFGLALFILTPMPIPICHMPFLVVVFAL